MPSPHPAKRVTCLRTCVSDVPASASVDTWGGDVQGARRAASGSPGEGGGGATGPGEGTKEEGKQTGPEQRHPAGGDDPGKGAVSRLAGPARRDARLPARVWRDPGCRPLWDVHTSS